MPRAVWNELLSRLHRELDDADQQALFRGSLIDDKMFAIDVKEWGMADLNELLRSRLACSRGGEKR